MYYPGPTLRNSLRCIGYIGCTVRTCTGGFGAHSRAVHIAAGGPRDHRYDFAMVVAAIGRHNSYMSKRLAAATLWFFAGSYLGSYLPYWSGVSDLLAPLTGLLAAAFFTGDPLGIIWARNRQQADASEPAPEGIPERIADAA